MSGVPVPPHQPGLRTEAGTVTRHALERYTPEPADRRHGVGLCLSGGGYRATLFHLGAVRRLNEVGLLGQLRTISSVSGGSILAAHLASAIPWPLDQPLTSVEWEYRVAKPLRAFTKRNIRTPAIARRFYPRNWFRTATGVEGLAQAYEDHLTNRRLAELPPQPNFVLCATEMSYGVNWVFERQRMGDYQVGYATPPSLFPVARAVAASSCFPPVFNPLPINLAPTDLTNGLAAQGLERDECIRSLRLTDGGNYDNLGLEPIWKDHAIVLCSDGGGTFDPQPDTGLIRRLGRYLAISDNQARSLRKRWLVASFINKEMEGAYWGIGSAAESYEASISSAYTKKFASALIANIRTDLDAFSDIETAVLENHGYILAAAALQRHLPSHLPDPFPSLLPPHPWISEDQAKRHLIEARRRTTLGRR